MRIAIYGDFTWDRLGASYRRALQQLGHQVTPLDTREVRPLLAPWMRTRIGHRLTIRSLRFRRRGTVAWNRALVAQCREARVDLVLIFNGDFFMPETARQLRSLDAKVFVFHADSPFPPSPNVRPEHLPLARESDRYFIWSRSLIARLREAGVTRAEYLPFAWDPAVFPSATTPDGDAEHDVVFIGGWDRWREAWLEGLASRFPLKIWGPDYWGTRTRPGSRVRRCWQGQAATGAEAARILARSKVTLNLLREQNLPDGVNMRTFEVPGCGGFSVATRTQGAASIFPEGQAGVYFDGLEECIGRIDYYLSHDDERVEIARAAHRIVEHHTYLDRAREILQHYDETDR